MEAVDANDWRTAQYRDVELGITLGGAANPATR